MCYYNRTQYSCGCVKWSKDGIVRLCEVAGGTAQASRPNQAVEPPAPEQTTPRARSHPYENVSSIDEEFCVPGEGGDQINFDLLQVIRPTRRNVLRARRIQSKCKTKQVEAFVNDEGICSECRHPSLPVGWHVDQYSGSQQRYRRLPRPRTNTLPVSHRICSFRGCPWSSGHISSHRNCPEERCSLVAGHYHRHEIRCKVNGCFLTEHHPGSHYIWTRCDTNGCGRFKGHSGKHASAGIVTSEELSSLNEQHARAASQALQLLNSVVLDAMGDFRLHDQYVLSSGHQLQVPKKPILDDLNPSATEEGFNAQKPARRNVSVLPQVQRRINNMIPATNYTSLDRTACQIRLFELFPRTEDPSICGQFYHVELESSQNYTAVSYAWGEAKTLHEIHISHHSPIKVRANIWNFLEMQSSIIKERKLFWIDAICIDQENVLERNHQVAMMKQIYANTSEVNVWLGPEADNSNAAMEFLARKAKKETNIQNSKFHSIWTSTEGHALSLLCERRYWRRMWIIQEIIHAEHITLWCGSKSVDWSNVEALYLTMKSIEDAGRFAHHKHLINVLQSPAAVMVWQRAHWRHPDTPTPTLQTLIEVFRQWQCSDIRDKVFALVNMASEDTAVTVDYSLSARDLCLEVWKKCSSANGTFMNMLSQILGLPSEEIGLYGRQLIDYKIQSADTFVLQKRLDGDSFGPVMYSTS